MLHAKFEDHRTTGSGEEKFQRRRCLNSVDDGQRQTTDND